MNGRPVGITVIAIILTIGAVFQIIAGTEALKITSFGLTSVTDSNISGWGLIISAAITLIAAAGLFTLAGWAWMLAVVVLGIRIVADIIAVLTQGASSTLGIASITNLVISGLILWYFMRPGVRASFGR